MAALSTAATPAIPLVTLGLRPAGHQGLLTWPGFYTSIRDSNKRKSGKHFVGFTPAVSRSAQKAMRQQVRRWKIHRKTGTTLEALARTINPIVRGWIQYYGVYRKSALYDVFNHLNRALVRWVRRKFKKLRQHQRSAESWLGGIARQQPALFAHWQLGILPAAE